MSKEKIGFIGIGFMGWPMAANLVRAGYELLPWDANGEQLDRFAAEFGTVRPSALGDLAEASVIITMLPTGALVRSVLTEGGDPLAERLASGAVVIDMSSSEPVGSQQLGEILGRRGVSLVDAPVSGGVSRAVDGALSIMAGASAPEVIDRVEPVLLAMGQKVFRTGAVGSGHATKALNNLISATNFAVASEALIIGQQFGLDPHLLFEIINASTGRSFATEIPIKQHVLTGAFATGFSIGLMAKDVAIAEGLAEALGVDAPVGRAVYDQLAQARDRIGAGTDHTAAYKAWREVRTASARENEDA